MAPVVTGGVTEGTDATVEGMPVTVYRNPGCDASLEACDELRRLGVRFQEYPLPGLSASSDELDLVKALWQVGSSLPVIRIGESEFHDFPSALRRLTELTNQRRTAVRED